MRSGELARLADVSVRALRHYHQVGVLAEPERRSNGYREYDVHDLVRVLRIKRLASLGIPLDRMRALLDDAAVPPARRAGAPDPGAGPLLDELDAELAGQIERLQRKRELIALLRLHGTSPDLPPELAPFVAVFQGDEVTPEIARLDHDQSVLLAHFVGEDGMGHVSRLYARIASPDLAPSVSAFSARFGALSAESTDDEVQALVEDFLAVFGPVLAEFVDAGADIDLGGASELFASHTHDVLSEPQQRALAEMGRRVDEDWAARTGVGRQGPGDDHGKHATSLSPPHDDFTPVDSFVPDDSPGPTPGVAGAADARRESGGAPSERHGDGEGPTSGGTTARRP